MSSKEGQKTRGTVVLETELGDIELELYPENAPISVANFLAHVDGGHFQGATFYRVVREDNEVNPAGIEVVQGGLMAEDFRTKTAEEFTGLTSVLPPIEHETTDETGLRNEYGVLAMARLAPGSATSEFFINMAANPVLDNGDTSRQPDGQGFATFGRVLKGMEVLKRIQCMSTDAPKAFAPMQRQILNDPVLIRRAYRVE